MNFYFCDTSALVKRYVAEIGSKWTRSILAPPPSTVVFIARISVVEFISAMARRKKIGSLSSSASSRILSDFRVDLKKQ